MMASGDSPTSPTPAPGSADRSAAASTNASGSADRSAAASTNASGIAPGLHARIALRLGALDLDVAFDVAPGEVVAVLGPNGAGKTTLLRALAGLVPIERGRIELGGRVMEDAQTGLRSSPQQRRVGVVFQQHLLFPHLSALENVAFGLRAQGVAPSEARARARDWLQRVGLAEHAATKPAALSGGQAQRVALARALATEPAALLLDEPLSALDVDTRRSVRQQLRRHLEAFPGPALLITHEPLEAITLADRLVIIEHGRIVQDDPPGVVARRPRSRWAARLVGLNHYRAQVEGRTLHLRSGASLRAAEAAEQPGDALVAIHPRAVALHPNEPDGSPRNTWRATVDALDIHDDQVRVHLDGPIPIVAQITAAALAELDLAEGSRVWVAVKATEIDHWPA